MPKLPQELLHLLTGGIWGHVFAFCFFSQWLRSHCGGLCVQRFCALIYPPRNTVPVLQTAVTAFSLKSSQTPWNKVLLSLWWCIFWHALHSSHADCINPWITCSIPTTPTFVRTNTQGFLQWKPECGETVHPKLL